MIGWVERVAAMISITYVSLFVFPINGPKQNARSLLTAVSDPAFYALSHGSKHFVLHGSSNNRLFQVVKKAIIDSKTGETSL